MLEKIYYRCTALILLASAISYAHSRTFFRPRAIIETDAIFFAQNNYNNYRSYFASTTGNNKLTSNKHLYSGVFYEHSQNSKKLASYFLPCNKKSITIREDGSGDVGSLWLSLIAPDSMLYSSVFSLCPTRKVLGTYVNYRQNFGCENRWWFDARFAWYEAKHSLHPRESLLSPEGILPCAATALQYLNSNALAYGKISPCTLKRKGFDDIELKVGYIVRGCEDQGHFDLYVSGLIPVSKKPTACFLFEPLVGRGHGGLGFGFNTGYPIHELCNTILTFMADGSFQYLFSSCERRSFDLCNSDWSRYLRLAHESSPGISFPAINALTTNVNVTPRAMVSIWAALHAQRNCWHGELGYNFWWKRSEKIRLGQSKTCLCFSLADLGIFDLANVCNPTTASTATISQSKLFNGSGTNPAISDSSFQPISLSDLDLCSASHPTAWTNTIYGSIARDVTICYNVINFALAGSYEFAHNRNALNQYGIWFTANVNF